MNTNSGLFYTFYGLLVFVSKLWDMRSDIPFDTAEKSALFDLKVLWEGFEKMGAKA
ncbi:hypothetical protein [Dyadobacter sp. CY326]|uniref:hypothetical protein n=1 Tax=Dyadobacter sp. CY326 TaxID=2907300 RepID=UPI001F161DF4|nr:hypothetical protein [Dyadobacter sp. CY326]MCE7067435.1 hypothetical protein [Dyadobacter sp. CY326]